ncbi:MAG: pilus assembly protein [Firmicutes bacterium]|nr:pilus assembly protein [Bacillota bacterium]
MKKKIDNGYAALKREDLGQALVEFVLIAPMLLIIICGVLQLALFCHANLLVHMAVRQAAEVYLQGGSRQVIRDEVVRFLEQYPFMEGRIVSVRLDTSTLMATVAVECEVPVVPPIRMMGRRPTVKASMSLGREIFDISRLPPLELLNLFRKLLRGEV